MQLRYDERKTPISSLLNASKHFQRFMALTCRLFVNLQFYFKFDAVRIQDSKVQKMDEGCGNVGNCLHLVNSDVARLAGVESEIADFNPLALGILCTVVTGER